MKRWVMFSIVFLLSGSVLAVAGGALWLWGTLPAIDTTTEVAVIERPVEVIRDEAGIPHIFAKSGLDAYFALGFVHAQDRFWQMETMRRLGAGRLSEVLGPRALNFDKWMRTLGLYQLAEQQVRDLSEPVRAALNYYAAGVNAQIEKAQRLPWAVAAPEFALLRYRPEPWKPADSMVWGKIMAAMLGRNWRDEILRARLARKLSPRQVGELWPLYPADAPKTIAKTAAMGNMIDLDRLAASAPLDPGRPLGASNAWALSSKKTTTRSAILANDPHLGFSAPVIWYLARIIAPDLNVTGATVPGVPFTILGHNSKAAWAMTSTQSDIQDLFVEKINADGQYMTPDGWKPFKTRAETIKVKGAKPVVITVRESRHGPIISDINEATAQSTGPEAVMALSATFLQPGDKTGEAFYRLNRAENWQSFQDALKDFQGPQSNFFFADEKGDIAFMAPGLVPIRKSGWGLVPSPGWTGNTDWTGFIPFNELPQALNPTSGMLVNANNDITPEGYPHFISFDWAPPYRAERILELLALKPQSVYSTSRLQKDNVSAMAKELLPLMLDIEPSSATARKAVSLLSKWDGGMVRNRAEPLIFSYWLLELNKAVYADELGDLFNSYLKLRPRFIHSVLTRRKVWCDDINTAETENCHARINLALERALKKLETTYGVNMGAWRWGDAHKAIFSHKILTNIPFINRFADLIVPTDGGNYTVNRGASHVNDPNQPFGNVHGAGFRAVYDLEDLRQSRFIIATGQSGNPVSSYYGDQMETWRDGRLRTAGQTLSALKNSAVNVLVLTPAGAK